MSRLPSNPSAGSSKTIAKLIAVARACDTEWGSDQTQRKTALADLDAIWPEWRKWSDG